MFRVSMTSPRQRDHKSRHQRYALRLLGSLQNKTAWVLLVLLLGCPESGRAQTPFRVTDQENTLEPATVQLLTSEEASIAQETSGFEISDREPVLMAPFAEDDSYSSDSTLFLPFMFSEIGGWLAQGYSYNPTNPANGLNRPVVFHDQANEYLLHQAYLFSESHIPLVPDAWELAARVDLMYGYDAHFIAAPGLEQHTNRTQRWNAEDQRYGLAMPQVFLSLRQPSETGWFVKLGHFYSDVGYESFAAPENLLNTHSFSYAYATPFTLSGAVGQYSPSEFLTFFSGYVQGWDVVQSEANEWSLIGGLAVHNSDHTRSVKLSVLTGEDVTNFISQGVPTKGGRQAIFLVYEHQITKRIRYVGNAVYGRQTGAVANVNLVSCPVNSLKTAGASSRASIC